MSLASSVAARGADHMKGHPFSALVGSREMLERIFGGDIPDEITNSRSPVAKGRVVWWHENYKMLMDCLGLCFIPVAGTTIFGFSSRGVTRKAYMPARNANRIISNVNLLSIK